MTVAMRLIDRAGPRIAVEETRTAPDGTVTTRGIWVTHRQTQALTSLSNDDRTISHVAYDWPGLGYDGARSQIESLCKKGLVDCVRMDHGARVYGLTTRGRQFIDAMDLDDYEDPEDL